MKKLSAGVVVVCLLLSTTSVWAPESERVIVVFADAPDVNVLSEHGGKIHRVFHIIPAVVVTLPTSALDGLAHHADITYIQPDFLIQYVDTPISTAEPVDQIIPWGVDRIDADLAWSVSTGEKVKVAVLDTGIDIDHPDLQANIHGGINTVAGYQPHDYNDDHGHGTFCAGIIAAVDNTFGVIGVAPDAWLYSVKVLDIDGLGYTSDIIEGIQWCIEHDMQVLNMSFGTSLYDQALHDACNAAWNHGCILVASEGLCGGTWYPAGHASVMAVAATDRNDYQGWVYGPELELVAPGERILSTCIGGGYIMDSGVSIGCPHVSGTAALVIAVYPHYSNGTIRRILQRTAEDLGVPGWDPYYGYGLVDAEAAVS